MQAPFHQPSLAQQLRDIEHLVRSAATLADGEYLPQMPRESEVAHAWHDASHASAALQYLATRVSCLDGAEEGLRLIKSAIAHLDRGRHTLAKTDHSYSADDVFVDIAGPGVLFRDAAQLLRGVADLAALEDMSEDDLLEGLLTRKIDGL